MARYIDIILLVNSGTVEDIVNRILGEANVEEMTAFADSVNSKIKQRL